MKISGTIDIECASWDRFAVGAVYLPTQGGAGPGEKKIFRSAADLVDFLLRKPGSCFWAHCGGAFDFLCIAEEMRRREIPCTLDLAGSRISRLVGGGITLRDSWPLVPLPLKLAAVIAGETVDELGLVCTCGRAETPLHAGCGGYCTIRERDLRARVADHCAEDARVLYRVLEAIQNHAEVLGLTLRGTLGGTAWATAKAQLDLPDADFAPALWRDIRKAYYGGRQIVVRPVASGPGSHWDLSSAYPAALAKTSIPIGDPSQYAGREARLCFGNDRPGVYSAVVTVPRDCFLPPLPVRVGGGRGSDEPERVTYPTGTVHGVWCLPELHEALARGCVIDEIRWCVVWSGEAVLFSELVASWFAARAKAGKNSPLGMWLRELANTLTGKFSEQPNRRSARMFPSSEDIKFCEAKRPCSVRRCVGACGQWDQLDMWGKIWSVPFYRPAVSGHIQWAAYLTAATRATWLAGAETQGQDLVYGHTDSLWSTSRRGPSPQGRALGSWEHKHEWIDFECAAPGAYRFGVWPIPFDPAPERATTPAEHAERAARRIPKVTGVTQLTDAEFSAGSATRDHGVMSFNEAAKQSGRTEAGNERGLFRRRHQSWTLPMRGRDTGRYGDRLLDAASGITFPVENGHQEEHPKIPGRSRAVSTASHPKGNAARTRAASRA